MALRFLRDGYFVGKVGIGTETPSANLDIENASGVTIDINSSSGDGQFRFQDSGVTKWSVGRDNTQQNFVFSNSSSLNSDNVLTLAHSTGNVGIGTTAPNAKLDVQGTQGQLFSVTDDLSGEIFAVADISGVPIMTVNSSGVSYFDGKVGIGTNSPDNELHIYKEGNAFIKVDSGSTSPYMAGVEFLRSSINGGRIYNDGGAVQVKLESYYGYESANPTRGGFTFKTAPVTSGTLVDAVRIDALGNVGIGTSSPGSKLHVQGTSFFFDQAIFDDKVGIGTTSPDSKLDIQDSNPFITIQGSSSSYVNAGVQFISNHASTVRGLGNFYYSAHSDVEWFSGLPYSDNDAFVINRNASYTVPSSQSSPAGIGASAGTLLKVSSAGAIQFNNYSGTNKTGTPTYILGTDALGNVVKVLGGDIPGGGGTVTGTGTTSRLTKFTDGPNGVIGDSGIQDASNAIAITINGNEEVGINKTNPTRPLHVSGVAQIDNGSLVLGGTSSVSGNNPQFRRTNSSNDLAISTGGSDRVTVLGTGNVGINTSNPGAPLSVVGSYSSSDEIIEIGGGTGVNTDFKLKIGAVDQDYIWFQSVKPGDNYYDLVFNPTAGNVGIGTTSPIAKLDVNGSVQATSFYNLANPSPIMFPEGGTYNGGGSETGYIVIKLPDTGGAGQNNMMTCLVRIFDYANNESFDVRFNGYFYGSDYLWTRNAVWIDSSANVDRNFTVRFGKELGSSGSQDRAVVTIGEASGTWSYPKVAVIQYTPGHSEGAQPQIWNSGWDVSVVEDYWDETDNTLDDTIVNNQVNNWRRNGQDLYYGSGTGDVGIGTTSPDAKLEVADSIPTLRITGTRDASWTVGQIMASLEYFSEDASGTSANSVRASINLVNEVSVYGSTTGLAFSTKGDVAGLPSERLRIDASGNVGIGTTIPDDKLHVSAGAIRLDNFYQLRWGGTGTGIYGHSSQGLNFYTQSGTTRLKIENSGDVGINTTSPDFKLDVDGTFGVSDLPFNTDSVSVLVADETIASEIITNGNFDTDLTDWTNSSSYPWTSATWTSSGVSLQTSGSAQYKSFYQDIGPITLGKTYKISYSAVKTSGTMYVGVETSPVGSSVGYGKSLTSSEVVSEIFTATATDATCVISFWGQNNSTTNEWVIDNVSIKEVTSASNQIQKRELGTGAFGPTPVGAYLPLTGGTLSGNLTITKSSAMMKVSEAGGGDIRMVAGGSTGYIGTYNNTSIQILQNGSNAIFIDTSKNIGIGTTSPDTRLEVRTDSGAAVSNSKLRVTAGAQGAYGGTAHFEGAYNDYGNVDQPNIVGKIEMASEVITPTNVGGTMKFFTKAAGGTYVTAPIERMRISSAGDIKFNAYGAGTLVSDASGNITVSSGGGAGGPYLPLSAGSGEILTGDLAMNNNIGIITKDSSGAFRDILKLNSSNILEIGSSALTTNTIFKNTGNVGINNTTPVNGKLVVDSDTETLLNTVRINHTRSNPNFGTQALALDVNLSGADNTTADRTNSGLWIDLDSSANGDAAHEHRIRGVNSDVRFSGFSDVVQSVYGYAESNNNTEKTAQLIGVQGNAVHDSNSTDGGVSNMYGVMGTAYPQDLGDVDNAFGGYFAVELGNSRGNANFGVSKGVEGHINIDKTAALSYGAMMAVSGIIDNNEGTVPNFDNQYLFKGAYQGTKGNNAFGIYTGGDKHYFEGNIGIGSTSPTSRLTVGGNGITTKVATVTIANTIDGASLTLRGGSPTIYFDRTGADPQNKILMDSAGLEFKTGTLDAEGDVHFKINPDGSLQLAAGAQISNQENTDIDSAAAEVVAQVAITYTAAFFDFVVKKGTNIRSGTVYACHDGTNVEFTETSTNDLGDTSDVVLSVDKTSTNLRLLATVASDDWSVKSLIRAI